MRNLFPRSIIVPGNCIGLPRKCFDVPRNNDAPGNCTGLPRKCFEVPRSIIAPGNKHGAPRRPRPSPVSFFTQRVAYIPTKEAMMKRRISIQASLGVRSSRRKRKPSALRLHHSFSFVPLLVQTVFCATARRS